MNSDFLLFADGTSSLISIVIAIVGVLISIGGWHVSHKFVVKREERKAAIDLMRNIAEHSHLSWNCHISLNNVHWRILDNDEKVEWYREKQYKLREELSAIQAKLYSDSVMVRLVYDEPECSGLVDALFALINLIRLEGHTDAIMEASNRYNRVFTESAKLFKLYDREVWNTSPFQEYMQETF